MTPPTHGPTVILERYWKGQALMGWNAYTPRDPGYVIWLAWVLEGWCPGMAAAPPFGLHTEAHESCPLQSVVDNQGAAWGLCPASEVRFRTEYVSDSELTNRYIQRVRREGIRREAP